MPFHWALPRISLRANRDEGHGARRVVESAEEPLSAKPHTTRRPSARTNSFRRDAEHREPGRHRSAGSAAHSSARRIAHSRFRAQVRRSRWQGHSRLTPRASVALGSPRSVNRKSRYRSRDATTTSCSPDAALAGMTRCNDVLRVSNPPARHPAPRPAERRGPRSGVLPPRGRAVFCYARRRRFQHRGKFCT
jgi:hypothetical protein